MEKTKGHVISVDIETGNVRTCLIDEFLQIFDNEQADFSFEVEPFIATACSIHTNYWPLKLIWMHEAYPELFNSHYFCPLKDIFINEISNEFATDHSNAAATGAGDVHTRDWDDHIFDIGRMFRTQSPKVHPTTTNFHPTKKNDYSAIWLSS